MGKLNSLAEEYKQRQVKMDFRLKQEVENHAVAKMQKKVSDGPRVFGSPLNASNNAANGMIIGSEKDAAFLRSKRSLALRIKDNFENQVHTLEQDKLTLIQRLNESLLELDRLNQEKTTLSQRLIEQLKFVRDMQRETQKGEDLTQVVSEDLRGDMRSEKEKGVQLREEVKKAEYERLRLLARIHQLSQLTSEGEIVQSDMTVDFKYKSRTFAEMQEEYNEVLERIAQAESDIDRLRAITIANQEAMEKLRQRIDSIVEEKRQTKHKLIGKQDDLDRSIQDFEREREQMETMQSRHIRLISTTLLFDQVRQSHQKSMRQVFNTIQRQAVVRHSRLQSLKSMRKVLKSHRTAKLKSTLRLWYTNALKPMRAKAQTKQIAYKMREKRPAHLAFYAWQCAFTKAQQVKHLKRQVLQSFIQSTQEYNTRAVKHYWTRWRDLVRLQESSKPALLSKFLLAKHRASLRRPFTTWKQTSLACTFSLLMHGLAQRLAFKQYLAQVFAQWKLVATDLKVKRVSVQTRVLKNLKINAMTQKQLRCQTWSLLRELRRHRGNTLKACFDQLRLNKEQQKYVKAHQQLHEQEIPRRKQAELVIDQVQVVDGEKYKAQAVKALAKCFGKQLQLYFERWRQATEVTRICLHSTVKQRIIKLYIGHLRQAFTRWVEYKGAQMLSYQSGVIQEYEEEAASLQNAIQESQVRIDESKQRTQCQSGKQIKKIMGNVINKRIREHFMQWKLNIDQKERVLDQADKVLAKLNRRQKRQAFDRYLSKISQIKQEEVFERYVTDFRFKLREKTRHRVYNAIHRFTQDFVQAKTYMRRLLGRLDVSLKDSSFKKWQRFKHFKHEKELQKDQNSKVAKLKELSDKVHADADTLEELTQQNKRLKTTLGNNSRRIIRHAFQRSLEASCQTAFAKWHDFLVEDRKKERVMRHALLHMLKNQQGQAFSQWKKAISDVQSTLMSEAIVYHESQMAVVEQESSLVSKKLDAIKDESSQKLSQQQLLQQQLMAKHQNTLKAMIQRKDNMDFMDKRRYILQQWRSYTASRKQALALMAKAITKTLWHTGFTYIKEHAIDNYVQSQRENQAQLLVKAYSKVKLRSGFNQWRKAIQANVASIREQVGVEIAQLDKKHRQFVGLVKNRIEDQLIEHRKHLKLLDCFIGWRNYINTQKQLKIKYKTYKNQLIQRDQQRSLLKWHSRVQKTHQFRQIRLQIDKVYDKNTLKSVFQAWLHFNHINKTLCRSLGSLSTITDRIYVQRSFSVIKLESQSRQFTIQGSKTRGIEQLMGSLHKALMLRKHQNFTLLRQKSIITQKLQLGQKAIIKYYLTKRIREYFQQWKQEGERRSLKQQMNEEGPVALECHTLKKVLYNLKKAAIDDGIEPREVQRVIDENKQKSIQTIEKAICRLFCYNEELYLLPKTLDRWKKWVHYRKAFRYWLNHLNRQLDLRASAKYQAFRQWKLVDAKMAQVLKAKTKEQLLKVHTANQQKMLQLADNLDLAQGATNDLTEQRDLLVKRYVGAQRLALACAHAQTERTTMRAFSHWQDQVGGQNSSALEDALKKNLERIKYLKERIKGFERSNEELADQNEELRQGALDGIEMAKTIDDLSREREKLSVDLADKAIVIRRLLEDNNNLSVRLSNAQDEAHNLIKMSQIKLQSEQRGLQYLDDY